MGQRLLAFVKRSAFYRRVHPRALRAAFRRPADVFGEIYDRNLWGGGKGEAYSGSGSRGAVVDNYIALVSEFIAQHRINSVVDLGCGDFYVGRQLIGQVDRYVGVDVVPRLIESHNAEFGTDRVTFESLDIVADPLPEGELCLIRQVLQHLSNRQIQAVLPKLTRYRHVLITEHHPHEDEFDRPNIDKVMGVSTRVSQRSAVVLDAAPFNLPVREVLSIPAREADSIPDTIYSRGFIKTFLIQNPAAA